MAELHALPPSKPVNSDAADKLDYLLGAVRAGEIESFMAAAFKPNGRWVMTFSGQIDTLQKIGILEAMKYDLLRSLED